MAGAGRSQESRQLPLRSRAESLAAGIAVQVGRGAARRREGSVKSSAGTEGGAGRDE